MINLMDVSSPAGYHPICEKIEQLERNFCSLASSVLEELIERQVDAKQIKKHLMALPLKLKRDVAYMVGQNLPDIRQKVDLDRLFVYLDATIWNFIDYTLLEHIIREFGSMELRRDMDRYVADITLFSKQTTVSQLIQYWPGRKDTPPKYCELTFKIDKDPDRCTLEELNVLRKELQKQFLPPLSECALLLCSCRNGSIVVKWFIAIDLVPVLISEIQKTEKSAFFEDNSIESIQVRDIVVYEDPNQLSSSTAESERSLSQGMLESVHVAIFYSV